jgi:hypothetical protein
MALGQQHRLFAILERVDGQIGRRFDRIKTLLGGVVIGAALASAGFAIWNAKGENEFTPELIERVNQSIRAAYNAYKLEHNSSWAWQVSEVVLLRESKRKHFGYVRFHIPAHDFTIGGEQQHVGEQVMQKDCTASLDEVSKQFIWECDR